jgi:hypothetical protein
MPCVRRSGRLLAAAVLLAAWAARSAAADVESLGDRENPRNVRFRGQLIEYVSATPAVRVGDVGSTAAWPAGAEVRWAVHLNDPRAGDAARRHFYGGVQVRVDERPLRLGAVAARSRVANPRLGRPFESAHGVWAAAPGRHAVSVSWEDSNDALTAATDALRVLLVVERKTWEAGEARFGSFPRRFRKSLEDLNALLDASRSALAPLGIVDRFRLDGVLTFDRVRGEEPPAYESHPAADVVVVCDEGGPLAGFALPQHSVGHAFEGVPAHPGLWSSWGEHALWRDLMRFRGVPDLAAYEVPGGGLPGRFEGVLRLPKRYAKDLLASPEQDAFLSEYTAVVANAKRGVARVGDPGDTASPHGHLWNWLPGRVDLVVLRDKKPLAGATVRWWRSRRVEGLATAAPGRQGVRPGAPPDGTATTDANGRATVSGDYLGRGDPRPDRSLWLLVEVEHGGETRFEVLYGLDLNLAYARGDKYAWAPAWEWERLLVANGALPSDR